MIPEVDIKVRKIYGGYRATVKVNGEWYASVDSSNAEEAVREAGHYASQIEIDEDGNW